MRWNVQKIFCTCLVHVYWASTHSWYSMWCCVYMTLLPTNPNMKVLKKISLQIFHIPPYVFELVPPAISAKCPVGFPELHKKSPGTCHPCEAHGTPLALNEAPFRYPQEEMAVDQNWVHFLHILTGCSSPLPGGECILRKVKTIQKPEDSFALKFFQVEDLGSDETSSNYTLLNIRSIWEGQNFMLRTEYGTPVDTGPPCFHGKDLHTQNS